MNIKRLAYEIRPASTLAAGAKAATARPKPVSAGIPADVLTRRIDEYLGTRGFKQEPRKVQEVQRVQEVQEVPEVHEVPRVQEVPKVQEVQRVQNPPLDFVCEEDVRRAIRAGQMLRVHERAIVTPSARELAEEHRIIQWTA